MSDERKKGEIIDWVKEYLKDKPTRSDLIETICYQSDKLDFYENILKNILDRTTMQPEVEVIFKRKSIELTDEELDTISKATWLKEYEHSELTKYD